MKRLIKKFNKKAAGPPNANPASILILTIAVALIFYVLLVPADIRKEILGEENKTINKSFEEGFVAENLLLKEKIGRLEAVLSKEKEIKIPNFRLVESLQESILREADSFIVKKTILSEESKIVSFPLLDINLDSIYISFQAQQRKGILKISINGKTAYESRMSDVIGRVALPKEALAKNNELMFSVEGGFLEDKNYQISDLKIIGTIKEDSSLIVLNPFRLSPQEYGSFESGTLTYFVSCNENTASSFTILLNENKIFSAVPTCDDLNRIELFKDYFKEEKNVLTFRASKGGFDFDNVKLNLKLSKTKSFLQYFEINDQLFSDVVLDKFKKITLELNFIDDKENKEAEVNVNGRLKTINQKTAKFRWELSKEKELLQAGRNYIEITPKTTLNIIEARIVVEEVQ